MAWLGLIGGIVIGGLLWEWNGAIILGFFGWLAGIIIGSKKEKKTASVVNAPAAPRPVESPANRIDRLERTVAALESRIARLETGGAPIAFVEAAPEPIPAPAAAPPVEAVKAAEAPVPVATEPPPPMPPPIPRPPPPPKEPAKPNFIVAWFTGGNTIVRTGAVILIVGLIFLLNYAREHLFIPPELRVGGVALFGMGLLVLGWKLRLRRTGYAVSLQGAGVATLYVTISAALHLYGLIAPEAAFVLLAAMAAFSAIIAVRQDSLALALIGLLGGFLAPILASTGSGNHVALFSYYLALNLGVVAIAWFKA